MDMNKYITKLPTSYTFDDLKRCVYTDEIIPFIKEALLDISSDGYALADILLQEELYKKGTYYSFIPKEKASKEYLYNFEFDFGRQQLIKDLAVNSIIEHLNSNKDAICIAHAGPKKLTDGWIEENHFNYPYPIFITHKEQLYFLLNTKHKSLSEVETLIKKSDSFWPRQMIYCTYSSKLQNVERKKGKISEKDIEELGKSIDKMLINAYDFNWYVFWELNAKPK